VYRTNFDEKMPVDEFFVHRKAEFSLFGAMHPLLLFQGESPNVKIPPKTRSHHLHPATRCTTARSAPCA